MNNLGIIASQISGHLWAPSGAYDAIASTTLSTATASITFSGIPSTYNHLQLRVVCGSASGTSYLVMKINGDSTAANYSSHYLVGFGSGTPVYGGAGSRIGDLGVVPTSATTFTGSIIDGLDYSSIYKYKTFRMLSGYDSGSAGNLGFTSMAWLNSSTAISSITFTLDNSANFVANSSFALYGIR
jgi:hypothetical protein